MKDLSRRVLSLALVALFAATYLPGLAASRADQGVAGVVPDCCAGMSCCRPGHDCAMHGGCGDMVGQATVAERSEAPTRSAATSQGHQPHRVCLSAPGCGATQALPAPHVFDPMLPSAATGIATPLAAADAGAVATRPPRSPVFEPQVPPPRA